MISAEQLAAALPDWMVEHPQGRSENELRLIIAGVILDRLGKPPCVPDVEALARAISRVHDVYDDEVEDLPPDPELDSADEWWMSPRRLARLIVNRMKD